MIRKYSKKESKNKPKPVNKYHSMGIYYCKTGEYKKAIESFKKALIIDSEHEDSKEKIKILIKKLNKKNNAVNGKNSFKIDNHDTKEEILFDQDTNHLQKSKVEEKFTSRKDSDRYSYFKAEQREKLFEKTPRNKKLIKKPRKLPDDKVGYYKKIYQLYKECGTLEKVGREVGLTRERIRQILVRGNKHGLFKYPIKKDLIFYHFLIRYYKNKEELFDELSTCKKKGEMINALSTDELSFNRLLSYHNLNISEIKICLKKRELKIKYDKYVQRIGYHPTTTEMRECKNERNIWVKITRYWGSMANFRQELEYPFIKQGNPKLKENIREWQQQRSASITLRKKSYMNMILRNLSANGALSNKYLADKCNIKEQNCRNILNSMIKRGEIIKLKHGAKTAYMLRKE